MPAVVKRVNMIGIALGSLALGLIIGQSTQVSNSAAERLMTGSAYGACSVVQDAVQHQWLTNEQGAALFAGYAARLKALSRAGATPQQAADLANCEKEIVRFQKQVGRP
jgi:hypothetical protein